MSRPMLLGTALVVMAASLFGTLSFLSRSANELGMGALSFVAWRAGLATLALLGFSLLVGRGAGLRTLDPRGLSSRQQVALAAACLCGALLNIALFAAFLQTTIAVVLITFYTFPAIVTLAAVRLYGERLDRRRVAALVLSSAGLGLVVLAPVVESGELNVDLVGVGLALFGAICQALFILLSGRGFRPFQSIHVAIYVIGAALLISVVLAVPLGSVDDLLQPLREPDVWIWIVAAGIAGAAIPTTAFLAGIGLIGPSRAAILMTFEPLVGVALAGALLGEHPAGLQLVGGAAVLLAAVILQVSPREPVPAAPEYSHPI